MQRPTNGFSRSTASTPIAALSAPEHAAPEVEAKVLGVLLKHADSRATGFEALNDEHFADLRHLAVFVAMRTLWRNTGKLNPVTVALQLDKAGDLDGQNGARPLLAQLIADAPNADDDLGIYTGHLVEWARRRTIMRAVQDAAVDLLDYRNDPAAVVDTLESKLSVAVTVGDTLDEVYDREKMLAELYDATVNPQPDHLLPSGIAKLDARIGGFRGGELYLIGGRPGGGKSALGGTIAHNLGVTLGVPGVFFSLEMARKQIINREIGYLTRLGHKVLDDRRAFSAHEQALIREAYDLLGTSGLYFDSFPYYTIPMIRARVRRMVASHGIKWIVVDYAGKVKVEMKGRGRADELAYITGELKNIAKEFNLPMIALHQLNRGSEGKPDSRPSMSDFKGSGSFEEDADCIMLCYRPEYYGLPTFPPHGDEMTGEDATGKGDIQVEKLRNGEPGIARCAFVGEYARWESLAYLDTYNQSANTYTPQREAF